MGAAKDALKSILKQNGGQMDRAALEAAAAAVLVKDGESQKKAAKSVKAKLELPIFSISGSTVTLTGKNKRKADAGGDASAAKKPKPTASASPRMSPRLQAQAAAKAAVPELSLGSSGPAAADGGKKSKKDKKDKKQKPPQAPAAGGAAPAALGRVTMMGAGAAATFWKEHRIEVTGDGAEAFRPVDSFADAGFNAAALAACKSFAKPTPIQAACWPIMMAGRDVIGVAETGSGKTLAFFLPAMMHVQGLPGGGKAANGPLVLVLAPTRELAMQSEEVCKAAGAPIDLRSICIYGGVPKDPQRRAIRDGARVVVATPGRLLDLEQEGGVSLGGVSYLVLDEADRMLDMGFEKDVRSIIGLTSPQRRTVMFTATWPDTVRVLASEFLDSPVRVNVGSQELAANVRVTQTVEVIDEMRKSQRLPQLLQKYHASRKNRVLVFALYKKEAARVEQDVKRAGYAGIAIHGDMTQAARTHALQQFKDGTIPLLIATDVAARGLDIPDVEVVINYTFPLTIEDYIHRIGRTGRGGKSGISHTLFTGNPQFEKPLAGALQNVLREAGQEVPEALLKFGSAVKKKEHKMYGAFSGGGDKDAPMKQATRIVF